MSKSGWKMIVVALLAVASAGAAPPDDDIGVPEPEDNGPVRDGAQLIVCPPNATTVIDVPLGELSIWGSEDYTCRLSDQEMGEWHRRTTIVTTNVLAMTPFGLDCVRTTTSVVTLVCL